MKPRFFVHPHRMHSEWQRIENSEKRAGEGAKGGAEAGTERGEESAAASARSVVANVEKFRGDAKSAAEEIGVHAKEAGEALERGHLALEGGVAEGQLVLLGLAGFRNSLLTRKFVGEVAEARGIARARKAVLRGLLERIESAGERALGLSGHRGFVGRAEAGIVENALKLRNQRVANLLLLAEELLVHRVEAGELLISELASLRLCARHGTSVVRARLDYVCQIVTVMEMVAPSGCVAVTTALDRRAWIAASAAATGAGSC